METIKIYLENVFKALPRTEEVLRIKNELLGDMEAKYEDFRAAGKSEHEATALTIGEFGNIDELLTELGIDLESLNAQQSDAAKINIQKTSHQDSSHQDSDRQNSAHQNPDTQDPQKIVHRDEAAGFLAVSRKASLFIAAGVALILLGASILVGSVSIAELLGGNEEVVSPLSVVFLLLLIIPAVGFFIYAGFMMEKYKFLESGEFTIEASLEQELTREHEIHRPKYIMGLIMGVGLILLAVIVLIVLEVLVPVFDSLSVSFLLFMVAIAVFIFIWAGMADGAYKKLLKTGDYAPKTREANKVIGGVAAFVWPLVTCVFLVWGLVYDGFHIAWIVFPVTGILFGGFAALYSILKGDGK
jgi:hypothetical protein